MKALAIIILALLGGCRAMPPSAANNDVQTWCVSRPNVDGRVRIDSQVFIVTGSCVLFHNYRDDDGRKIHAHATFCGDITIKKCM